MSTCTSAGQQDVMDNMFALSSMSTSWPGGARRYKAWARFKVKPDMKLLWCWQRGLSEPPPTRIHSIQPKKKKGPM